MGEARPTEKRRELGKRLKELREQRGLSQSDAATVINHNVTRLSRVEDGRATLAAGKFEKLLDLYGVSGAAKDELLAKGVEARRRAPRRENRAYTDELPGAFRRFADLQADAQRILIYQSAIIPSLLQSPAYIHATLAAVEEVQQEAAPREIESRAAFAAAHQRQTWESINAKELRFILGEAAVTDTVESDAVMREQLAHLLDVIHRYENVSIQLLPAATPRNPARGKGFNIFEFANLPRVAFISVPYGPTMFIDDQKHTSDLVRMYTTLEAKALDQTQTRKALQAQLGVLNNRDRS